MMEPDGRYGEDLRRALSVVVDPLEPAGEGLERIKARTAHRPAAFARLTAYVTYPLTMLAVRVRIAASWAGTTAAHPLALIAMLRSIRHWPRRALGVLRQPGTWLRPVLAVAGALAFVAIATVLVPRLRHTVEAALASNPTSSSSVNPLGSSTGAQGPQASGGQRLSSGSHSPGAWSSASPAPCLRPSHHGGSSGSGSGSSTLLFPLGPMPGPSQSVQPQMLGLLPPGPPNVVPNSCYPSITQQVSRQASSTPPGSRRQTSSGPPSSTPPTTPPTTTPPTTTPPPTSPAPQGSTSPTGMASGSPIPG